jgi:hypothetical protein
MAKDYDDDEDDDRPVRKPRNSRDDDDDDGGARPSRRRDEDDDDYDAPRRKKPQGNGLALTSMILGIVSIVMVCCCAYLSPLLGIAAIVLGFMGKSKGQSGGMSIAGIITGAFGALAAIVLLILAFSGAIQPMDVREFQKK